MVGFALLFKLDISAMEWMTKPFWVASGFSLEQIAALTTGRLLATLGGAALGGVIATRIGIFHALWSLGLVQLLSSLGYAAAAASGAGKIGDRAAALFENFAAGLGTAAFLAFLMSVCERRYAATQFALLSAVFALSRWLAGLPSGTLVEHLGYARYFFLTFLMGLPAYLLLPRIRSAIAGESSHGRGRALSHAARHGRSGEHHEDHEHGLAVADPRKRGAPRRTGHPAPASSPASGSV